MHATAEAFDEDAISLADALDASDRFLLSANHGGYRAQLYAGPLDHDLQLVSLHEVWHLCEVQLDRGVPVQIGGVQ